MENNIVFNVSDALVEELYHELLHLSSTSYVVDFDTEKVNVFSGFVNNFSDINASNNSFNGLTEGFTQYLTSINNDNFANYDVQIDCIQRLIDLVGLDTVKKCYFNNKLGIKQIVDKLSEKGLTADYVSDLEAICHVETITILSEAESNQIDNRNI